MSVEQPHQRLPLNGCERTFGQHVCQLFCGAHTSNSKSTVQNDAFKKPNPSQHGEFVTRVSNWDCGLFKDQTDDGFVVLENVKSG